MAKAKNNRVIFIGKHSDLSDMLHDWRNDFELSIDNLECLSHNVHIATFPIKENKGDPEQAMRNFLSHINPKFILSEDEYKKLMKQADDEGALTDGFKYFYFKP